MQHLFTHKRIIDSYVIWRTSMFFMFENAKGRASPGGETPGDSLGTAPIRCLAGLFQSGRLV